MIKDTSRVMEPEPARNNPPINTQVMARDEAGDRVPMITDVGMPTITNTTVVMITSINTIRITGIDMRKLGIGITVNGGTTA